MKFTTISLTNTTVNNACSMEATTSFYANGATFNFTQGYLKAPKMEFVNGTVNLSDGSMLDATTSIQHTSRLCQVLWKRRKYFYDKITGYHRTRFHI